MGVFNRLSAHAHGIPHYISADVIGVRVSLHAAMSSSSFMLLFTIAFVFCSTESVELPQQWKAYLSCLLNR